MRASSPVRQLALLGAVALVGLLALRAGTVEAGPGRPAVFQWTAPADTDTVAVTPPAGPRLGPNGVPIKNQRAFAVRDTAAIRAEALRAAATADSLAAVQRAARIERLTGSGAADSAATALLSPDSLALADTVVADSTRRAFEYLPGTPLSGESVSVAPRRVPGIRGRLGAYWQRRVTLDSTALEYTVREEVGGTDVRAPALLTLDEFVVAQRRATLQSGFRTLAAQRADRGRRRGGVGFTVDIPGGETSAFRTLFGKNEVDLTVSGTSNVDVGASYNTNELQESRTGNAGVFAPDFGQDLNLNVAGTIGDKLRINVNYDTQSQFEFENQVSLVYSGYDDDIVQRIEAGNVFLQTPSELIQGGQRLFGLRTDLRFGPLALTAVASQQDAETNERTLEGGSESTPFSIAPTEYEDDTHFFLGYAFHNLWDSAHEQPGVRQLPPGFRELVGIEVWKHDPAVDTPTNDPTVNIITAVALADLAEPGGNSVADRANGLSVLRGGEEYLADVTDLLGGVRNTPLPDSLRDVYSTADLDRIRTNQSLDLSVEFDLPQGAFERGRFRRLRENVDYTVDGVLGVLSLTQRLSELDYIAVAYQYRVEDANSPSGSRLVTVGEFGQNNGDDIGRPIVLKLLRGQRPTPQLPLWDMTMRNIYRIGGRSLNPSAFTLGITYEAPGNEPRAEFPDLTIGDQLTLAQILGLDRVNQQGQPTPDFVFDFQPGITVDVENGRVIFPVRRPFGSYLRDVLLPPNRTVSGNIVTVTPTSGSAADAASRYVFDELYNIKATNARNLFPQLSRYRIAGEFRSASQSTFPIGFNLVQGTVRVTSGGQELSENTDYRVNYNAGTLEIVNPTFLQNGQQVRVQFEQNRLFSIGSTTLLGLRADYRLAENTTFGGTLMRLTQRPIVDKFRLGEEAFQNTIAGLDGRYLAEPRWITRVLDRLPLIQTRAPSRVEIRGEIARLTPGQPETIAFNQTVRRLTDGYELPADERNGLSFIDDFEGSENAYSQLIEPNRWRLAAAPTGAGPANADPGTVGLTDPRDVVNPLFVSNWRGLFAWYSISLASYRDFRERLQFATLPIAAADLYPERYRDSPNSREAQTAVGLLDLYFDPTRRGPYNYNRDLNTTVRDNPETVWGGMIQPIDGAYSDFEGQNNIEFVEMLVEALGGRNGETEIQPGAKMFVDLGVLNEDVVPDGIASTEDGIPNGGTPGISELNGFGRTRTGATNTVVDFFGNTGRTEDVGFDGLPSRRNLVAEGGQDYELSEQDYFSFFLDNASLSDAERARSSLDPSADDYHHFNDAGWFDDPARFPAVNGGPSGASVQERFSQWLVSPELNSIEGQSKIARSGEPGISTLPNSEDIDGDLGVNRSEQYHRYEIPLDPAGLRSSPFFENTVDITTGPAQGQTFYLLRIPVRTSNRVTSGFADDDFSSVEAVRLWTTGHSQPATIRVASLQLVGSQWRQSERVGVTNDDGTPRPGIQPDLFVATINNEESPDTYAIPRQAIYRTTAQAAPGAGTGGLPREQSLVLRAQNLGDDQIAAVTRSYTTRPIDFTRYSNVRMYVHGHGFERDDDVRVVVRLGDDETENYYEYEQPIVPFSLRQAALIVDDDARADSLWQTATPTREDRNSVNIVLSELNKLKVARDNAGAALDEVYRSETAPEGAPAGARIAIRGQPSIQDVRAVVIGVRNGPGGQVVPIDTAEVWVNEFRVSGYDDGQGASGFVTANVVLADVGSITARFSQTQDGFGALGGGLGSREFADRTAVSLTSSFNAHRLLPERFGWNIPLSYTLTANESTPRFDPNRGDIRLNELVEQTLNDTSATAPAQVDREQIAQNIIEQAQTVSGSRNFRVQASKTGSRSPYLRYTVDGLTAAYTQTAQTARSPSSLINDADSWAANLAYRVAVPRPKTVRPFWLLGGIPVVRALSGLRLNVLPQTVSFATDARRSMSFSRTRLVGDFAEPDSVTAFRNLPRQTQLFDHGRQLDMQYNPFPFLQVGYGSNTDQDLGAAGQNESFRIYVERAGIAATDSTAAVEGLAQTFNISPAAARDSNSVVRQFFGLDNSAAAFGDLTILGGSNLDVLPVGNVLSGIFSGDSLRQVRTRGYTQTLTAALRISTARVRWLSWIRPQALSYQTSYQWLDDPIANRPDLDVANAGTRIQLQTGLQLAPTEFWRLFPFYRRLEASAGRGPRGGAPRRGAAAGRPAQPAPQPAAAADSSGRRGFQIRPALIGRDLFLAATGLTDVTLTYRGAFTSSTGGLLGDSYSLLSGLRGAAPSLGYRLGLNRALPFDQRLTDPDVGRQYADQLSDQHTFEARSTVEPFRGLRVGLNWQTTFQETRQTPFTITRDVDDPNNPDLAVLTPLPISERGSGTSTVYAFGGSYEALLDRHRQRLLDDTSGEPDTDGGRYTSEYLLRTGLSSDFQEVFTRGLGTFGPRDIYTIPVPGWDITYSGLGNLPLFRAISQQVTLRHNYSATSQADYSSQFTAGGPRSIRTGADDTQQTFNLAAPEVDATLGSLEANTVTVNERFQPLVGASVNLKGGIQTDVTWNRSNLFTLQATAASLNETIVEDVQVQISYAKTGMRLLGLRRLNNNLRLTLTASLGTNKQFQRSISQDLADLLAGRDRRNLDPTNSTRRIQLWPRISYTVSNQVTADVFVRYERTTPRGGVNPFSTSSLDGGVSLRILFSN